MINVAARSDGQLNKLPTHRVKFRRRSDFHRELRAAVNALLADNGEKRTGGWAMVPKCAIILIWLFASYVFVVFFAQNWWQAGLGVVSFGFAVAGVGFSIQHDANHGSLAQSKWLGRLVGASLDLLGASSFYWRTKHNVLHHQYPNVAGLDDDIDPGPALRLAPAQKRYWFHRYQPYYAWFLYGLLTIEWILHSDYQTFVRGSIGNYPVARPRGWELILLFSGKLFNMIWMLVIPSLFHPFLYVLAGYVAVMLISGLLLAVTFQLAHCVDLTHFYGLQKDRQPDQGWAEHQLATTCDFAPNNQLLTWFLGGLNYQVIHHLFPKISHRHYPKLAPTVAEVCRKYGLTYRTLPSVRAALRSHVVFLHNMGRAQPQVANQATQPTAEGNT